MCSTDLFEGLKLCSRGLEMCSKHLFEGLKLCTTDLFKGLEMHFSERRSALPLYLGGSSQHLVEENTDS